MRKIDVTILTKNIAKLLNQVLDRVESCVEIVGYDTGSDDHAIEIARGYFNVVWKKTHRIAEHNWVPASLGER